MGRLVLAIAMLLDVATTWYGIKYLGLTEANPLMMGIVHSVPLMLLAKATIYLIIAGIMRLSDKAWRWFYWWEVAVLQSAIVVWNLAKIGGW